MRKAGAKCTSIRLVKKLDDGILYPDTMVADPQGQIFLNIHQLVLRLVPVGDSFDEEWLAAPNCGVTEQSDHYECICKP